MKLDMKGWKKVSEHPDHTILRNPMGHELKVAHRPLGKNLKEELRSLPIESGKVPAPKMSDGGKVKQSNPKLEESKKSPKRAMYADGSHDVQPSDAAQPDQPPASDTPEAAQAPAEVPGPQTPQQEKTAVTSDAMLTEKRRLYNIRAAQNNSQVSPDGMMDPSSSVGYMFGPQGEAPDNFDAKAWDQASKDYDAQQYSKAQQATEQMANIEAQNKARSDAGLPALPLPAAAAQGVQAGAAQANAAAPQPTQGPPQQSNQDPLMIGEQQKAFQTAVQQSQGAALAGEQADITKAKAEQDAYKQQVASYQNAANQYQKHYDSLENERQAFIQDVKDQHITPKQLFSGMDVPQRIGASIGLILGGFGGPGHNQVLESMQRNIDRDVDAQKAELGKRENLLSANMKQFGNLRDAADMTRLQMASLAQAQLGAAAAKAGTQRAVANYLDANSKIQQNMIMPNIQNLAIRRMMGGISGGGGGGDIGGAIQAIRMVNPEMAKSLEGRFIPGVGLAQVPVPDKVREDMAARSDLSNKLAELEQFSEAHSGSVDPKVISAGGALARNVQDAYRRGNAQGVFREAEKDFVEKSIGSDPTQFFASYRSQPGYKVSKQMNDQTLNNMYKSYGINRPQIKESAPKE